jgi:hypothetical protein
MRKKELRGVAAGLLAGALLVAPSAHASGTYPAALSKALDRQFPGQQFCVPLCTACHLTTRGGPHELNVFGVNLFLYGELRGQQPDTTVDPALDKYFKTVPPAGAPQADTLFIDGTTHPFFDSDHDGKSDYTELQNFDSPSVALPRGEKEFCPDVTYGCFARIAAARPPVNRLSMLGGGLLLLGLTVIRRLRRAPDRA